MRLFHKKKNGKKIEEPVEKYLMSVYSGIELAMAEGILKGEKIPMQKKHKGIDGALSLYGFTNLETEIYVSKDDYERATEIMQKSRINKE